MNLSALVAAFRELHPVWQATLAGVGTWALAVVGATGMLTVRRVERRPLDAMLGFAAGVMVAASGRWRALWYGQLSAIVEPVAAGLGAALVLAVGPLLPYALGFAAGAMLYVVVEDLIPETERGGNIDVATLGFILGFALMMALDNALG